MYGWFGTQSRSTYHVTTVNRVRSYLAKICTMAEKERSLVQGRITDCVGYDGKKQVWYLCEIKVVESDLMKSPVQIEDTARRFKRSQHYAKTGGAVIPVVAIPKGFHDYLIKDGYEKWASFRDTCRKLGIALWLVEQSTIRQLQGPKPKVTENEKRAVKIKSGKSTGAKSPKLSSKAKLKSKTRSTNASKGAGLKTGRTTKSGTSTGTKRR